MPPRIVTPHSCHKTPRIVTPHSCHMTAAADTRHQIPFEREPREGTFTHTRGGHTHTHDAPRHCHVFARECTVHAGPSGGSLPRRLHAAVTSASAPEARVQCLLSYKLHRASSKPAPAGYCQRSRPRRRPRRVPRRRRRCRCRPSARCPRPPLHAPPGGARSSSGMPD